MAADADAGVVDALSDWAWELGMVFQIADDALDLVAEEETIGKPAGSDIREGKFTLPVLQALAGPAGERVRRLLQGNHPYADDVVNEVIEIVRDGGHVDASLSDATRRLGKASQSLAIIPDGEPKRILEGLGDYLLGRVEAARS
jgi:geranylgeranyl pyrophosphate synthase